VTAGQRGQTYSFKLQALPAGDTQAHTARHVKARATAAGTPVVPTSTGSNSDLINPF
jgi:hypothetical protein